MLLDGRRILVQGAELHYFRLPSPGLWRDVLEKLRAAGFNTVSLYFDWAYHSPKPGVYDFTGVRDVDRLLRTIEDLGLWAVVRPGPYINAETTDGGFPAWLKLVPGRARTSAPGYTAAYTEWLDHVNPIIARHQVTRGGSVLLYNVENEYQANADAAYMQALQDKARAGGIDVPIVTNVCCDAGSWASTWGSGPGAVQIPGVDDYPQSFDCANAETTWGPWGEGVTERVRDDAPGYAAEYQAGAIDLSDAGYQRCRELTGPEYMRFFYKNNAITSGSTLFSYYMGFGGTNWGWLSQPNDVYTSYDYGAAITEGRQLTAKYDEFKRQDYFLTAVAPLTRTDPAAAPVPDNPALLAVARSNPDTGTHGGLYGERHGWSLPGYPDGSWRRVGSLAGTAVAPGVTWYRTTFRLDLPRGQDTSVALRFAGTPPAGHRVMLFLNGWNLGLYGGGMGPQTDFVLPAGLLRQDGTNTLAFAVTAREGSQLGPASLVALGTQRGGVPAQPVRASEYDPRTYR